MSVFETARPEDCTGPLLELNMKSSLKLAGLSLIAALILFVSITSKANVQCTDLFEPEKINLAGETLEDLARRFTLTENLVLKLAENRMLSVNYIPAPKGKPTFLLLPGVNRSFSLDEPAVQLLGKLGNGVITFDFSTQPLSVVNLDKNVKPYFEKQKVTLEDLVQEVENLIASFKVRGVENIIPVSLSFSGAVTPYLKGFPLIIETVPMTSNAATNPELATNIQKLRSLEIFNPFLGPVINRNLLDLGYRQQWSQQVDRIVGLYKLPEDKKKSMIEGYLSMSKAAEGFDWKNVDIPKDTRRAFLVAENESPSLLRNQLETFLRLSKSNKNVFLFMVKKSGHILPSDQPLAYGILLSNVLGHIEFTDELGGGFFDPETKQMTFMTRPQLEDVIEQFLKENKE